MHSSMRLLAKRYLLRDGTLLELFRELGVGESLLPQDKLVGSEPHRRLPVRQVPVLQNKTHFSVLWMQLDPEIYPRSWQIWEIITILLLFSHNWLENIVDCSFISGNSWLIIILLNLLFKKVPGQVFLTWLKNRQVGSDSVSNYFLGLKL